MESTEPAGEHIAVETYTAEEVMQRAREIAATANSHRTQSELYEFGEKLLHSPSVEVRLASVVFEETMEPNPMLGNSLANTGKYLSRSDETAERGKWTLACATRIFEKYCIVELDKLSCSEQISILAQGYSRVAALQDEAGDKIGARQTALLIGPRLIELRRTVEEVDEVDLFNLEYEMSMVAQRTGLNEPVAQELIKLVENSSIRKLFYKVTLEKQVINFIEAGFFKQAFELYKLEDPEEEPSISQSNLFWSAIRSHLDSNDEERVKFADKILDAAEEHDANLYTGHDNLSIGFSDIIYVLGRMGRDTAIIDIVECSDSDDLLSNNRYIFEKLVYGFGYDVESERFSAFLELLCLDGNSDETALVHAFNKGKARREKDDTSSSHDPLF